MHFQLVNQIFCYTGYKYIHTLFYFFYFFIYLFIYFIFLFFKSILQYGALNRGILSQNWQNLLLKTAVRKYLKNKSILKCGMIIEMEQYEFVFTQLLHHRWNKTGLNSVFLLLAKAKEPCIPYYLPIAVGGIWIHGFLSRARMQSETASFRIWSQVTDFISLDNDHYVECTSYNCWSYYTNDFLGMKLFFPEHLFC